jgi:O-antigen ligase
VTRRLASDAPSLVGAAAPPEGGGSGGSGGALIVLQIYVITLLVLPSNATVTVIGASGFPAGIVGMLAAALYFGWVAMGLHDPRSHRYPTRASLIAVWVLSLASYVALQLRDRTPAEASGGDRWLLFLLGLTGIMLLASEAIRTLEDFLKVSRSLLWAGSFCGVVAILQWKLHLDLAALIGSHLPGFSYDPAIGGIQQRDGLNRVPGTTLHPIELGAVSSMLLPLAIAVAFIDRDRPRWQRLLPVVLVGACIPLSVSRTPIVVTAVALMVFIPQLRLRRRLMMLATVPLGVAAVALATPKVVTTLTGFFAGSGTDPSVQTRTDDYQFVGELVSHHRLLGYGGGTYLPADAFAIFDNAYLKWLVEFGYVGLVVLVVFYMLLPVASAITIRRRTAVEEYGLLAAALSAGLAGAAVASATFDAFAFPTQASTQALFIGLVGALWQIALRYDARLTPAASELNPHPRSSPMDTLDVWRALVRNRWPVLAALALSIGLAGLMYVTHPPRYEASSTLVLVPPPGGLTDTQLRLHPEWSKLDPDNPYTRQYDPGTILTILSLPITSEAGKADIQAKGGSPDYRVEQSYSYGATTPFSKIVATAGTADAAIRTNTLVLEQMQSVLKSMQAKEGTSSRYFVTAQVAAGASVNPARTVGSHTPVMVGGLLAVLLVYVSVGIGDAVRLARRQRKSPRFGTEQGVPHPLDRPGLA